MAKEIINKVAQSALITLDLKELYPKGKRISFDIEPFLFQGLIVKEKEFREAIDDIDWSQYKDNYLAFYCSSDAIIPSWVYLLLTTKAQPYVKKAVIGDLTLLESLIFNDIVSQINVEDFKEKPVIIKGCTDIFIPETAYSLLIQHLQPHVKSLMFGEACSTVPLYKKKKHE